MLTQFDAATCLPFLFYGFGSGLLIGFLCLMIRMLFRIGESAV